MLPANWLTEVIKLAALAALAVTLYILFWPRIKAMWAEQDPDLRTKDLQARHIDAQANDAQAEGVDAATRQGLRLRHIKSAVRNEQLTCLFVNDGDTALKVSVEIDGDGMGSIDPSDYLPAGGTGSIRLELPSAAISDDVLVSIRYDDERGHVRRERYIFRYRYREREFVRHPEAAG